MARKRDKNAQRTARDQQNNNKTYPTHRLDVSLYVYATLPLVGDMVARHPSI